MKTEKRPVEITVAGELPGFEYGGCRGLFLNLGLDVEVDGVTYHLSSSFAEDSVLGKLNDLRFQKLSAQYETEQAEIQQLAASLEREIEK